MSNDKGRALLGEDYDKYLPGQGPGYGGGSASFDGKSLTGFLASDHDYFDNPIRGKSGNPMVGSGSKADAARLSHIAAGGGPRSGFFAPLRQIGMNMNDMQFYADKAEIKNVNSASDMRAIADAFLASYDAGDEAKAQKMQSAPPEPEYKFGRSTGYYTKVNGEWTRNDIASSLQAKMA